MTAFNGAIQMRMTKLLSATALASAAFALPQVAWAQTTDPTLEADGQEEAQAEADQGGSIVVTGSRIARPNLDSAIPVTSVTGEELVQTGRVSIGDTLNDLPALNSTFSQANSTRFLGTGGLNLLDLRGLGTQRTLVLVNGRRHVGADILSNAVSPDVNTFPSDLIERVDVVTGGNSAIYGSEAIAGVVNFVLKDDFEGVQVRGQGGISEYGDAGAYSASIVAGTNFADNRGNVAVNLEYARQNAFFASGRDYLRNNNNFIVVDTDPAGAVNGSDGVPDRLLFRDIRTTAVTTGGMMLFGGGANARCGRDPLGAAYTCSYLFMPDGTLVPQTGARVGLAPNGSFIGGNGENLREGKLVQIQPQLDRYSANLIGQFEISPAFVPFVEAKYVRTESVSTGGSGPAFIQGGTVDGFYERPRLDNPYLSAQARSVIERELLAANPAAVLTDETRFSIRKNLTDLGIRTEEARRETYRVVAGVRGNFATDWNYEVSANYGEFQESTKVLGNLNVQRFLLAMDAVRDPSGNIVCGSRLDPTRAYDDFAGNPAVLAADIAACQPLNPFGQGNISDAARDFVLSDTISRGKITQFVGSAFVSGTTGNFLNLPGGPIGVAIGGEYRRDTAFFRADPLVEQGYTFYNALTPFEPDALEVKEAFGEVRLPILADMPFAQNLTISGSGRVSDYSQGSAGTVYAYGGSIEYAPIRDIRFRANYSRSVRAPNLTDLFSSVGQNFAPGFGDPCSERNIGTGSPTRAANCAAAGRPAGYDYVYQSSLEILSGGNPVLKEETSDSWTYGFVFEPSFARGFALTVDYYNIRVNDVITAPSAQQIANACYDLADLNNQFCDLFERAGAGGGPNGEEPFRILEGNLQQTLLNYAGLKVRGIDVDLSYRTNFAQDSSVGVRLVYTHQFQNDSFLDPTDPGRADRRLDELGFPKDAFNFDVDLKLGQFFVNYQARYLSSMLISAYEDQFSVQGRPPQNADYADILEYGDVVYMDARVGVQVTPESNFYLGVDNFTNRTPPLFSTGIGGGSGIYEPRGRYFYAGVVARF